MDEEIKGLLALIVNKVEDLGKKIDNLDKKMKRMVKSIKNREEEQEVEKQ